MTQNTDVIDARKRYVASQPPEREMELKAAGEDLHGIDVGRILNIRR